MFVPRDRHDEAAALRQGGGGEIRRRRRGRAPDTMLGPVVSQVQYDKIQDLIESGIAEGATLVTGGPGRPGGLNRGYYRAPDRLRQCDAGHAHRPRGDLRAGAVDPAL